MNLDDMFQIVGVPLSDREYIRDRYGGQSFRVSKRTPRALLGDPSVDPRLKALIYRLYKGRTFYVPPTPTFRGEKYERLSVDLAWRYAKGESVYRFAQETGLTYNQVDKLVAGEVGLTEHVKEGWIAEI